MSMPLMPPKESKRIRRVKRWQRVAKIVAKSSAAVNKEFQALSN